MAVFDPDDNKTQQCGDNKTIQTCIFVYSNAKKKKAYKYVCFISRFKNLQHKLHCQVRRQQFFMCRCYLLCMCLFIDE